MKSTGKYLGAITMFAMLEPNIQAHEPIPAVSKKSLDSINAGRIIDNALKDGVNQTTDAREAMVYLQASDKLIELIASNVLLVDFLKTQQIAALRAKEPVKVKSALKSALLETREILFFKPESEAPLPEGFPDYTPVGEIRVNQYPAYRIARVSTTGRESAAFWTLFYHIKKNDIEMTAPVEMTYKTSSKDLLEASNMAFLYQNPRLGKTGSYDKVLVQDVPSTRAVSIGMRGDLKPDMIDKAKTYLEAWLKDREHLYEVTGPLRVMGYNSPMVSSKRRYSEVQIPIREKSK